ncbi:GNAT family N-acetyltransferase [Sphingomonas sp. AP4-R1]|uniref:acyl-homoserine-lactone synthase n=1 Tax=Sphingomonas sp. AP4-R1 TaxID=2735134 RepID=UPI0014932E0B|nr:acyl-homoserine-lactone synthase [Sphingomonas sp. AP4-R1]QJU59343.1 GNAT family N-acetyltransferase [Sphingomonas sp. AP4-R1]
MIRIYHGAHTPGSDLLTDDMHRDRKRIFVDLLKWEVPVVADQFEIDQFDTCAATYLVACDASGSHLGSIRLLPTDSDHILGTIFPELCDQPVPRSPHIQEISRGCLSPRLRAPERRQVRNALTTAAVRYAMMRGIWSFTCIAESGWLRQILALGWDCRPLGTPRRIGRAMAGALQIEITTETLRQLQQAGTFQACTLALAGMPARAAA